jgi:hypothetical protein
MVEASVKVRDIGLMARVTDYIAQELFETLCYKEIGRGMSRKVFSSHILPDHVIKVEEGSRYFQNQYEWTIWNEIYYQKEAKWFAPCEWISPTGSVLIMKKTTPVGKYPDKMPAFLTDFKKTNYGMYNNHIVCHDYGTADLIRKGLTKRMIKVKFWNEG